MNVISDNTGTESVRETMDKNIMIHNIEETPLFAKDIERKRKSGIWL